MPRSLSFGNGTVLVTVDKFARLRDLYFPYVGLENHIGGGYMHRVGVWVDNQYSWLDDGSWEIAVDANDQNQGVTTAISRKLGIRIEMVDILHHTKNCYIRRYILKSETDETKQVKLFINQQFEISQTEKGDTAYFEPESHSVVHYEGRRAFVIGLKQGSRFFDDYSVGIFHIEGKEGTYKDAEDGILEKNTIEHGRVDSVVAISCTVTKEGGKEPIYYWIAVGSFIEDAKNLHFELLRGDPQLLIDDNSHFWGSWVNRLNMRFYGLGERVIGLFNMSQLYLRSHVDHRGAIIASGHTDNTHDVICPHRRPCKHS
jgi:GH15 family glucan-1,4-alpha-glucosidase